MPRWWTSQPQNNRIHHKPRPLLKSLTTNIPKQQAFFSSSSYLSQPQPVVLKLPSTPESCGRRISTDCLAYTQSSWYSRSLLGSENSPNFPGDTEVPSLGNTLWKPRAQVIASTQMPSVTPSLQMQSDPSIQLPIWMSCRVLRGKDPTLNLYPKRVSETMAPPSDELLKYKA